MAGVRGRGSEVSISAWAWLCCWAVGLGGGASVLAWRWLGCRRIGLSLRPSLLRIAERTSANGARAGRRARTGHARADERERSKWGPPSANGASRALRHEFLYSKSDRKENFKILFFLGCVENRTPYEKSARTGKFNFFLRRTPLPSPNQMCRPSALSLSLSLSL